MGYSIICSDGLVVRIIDMADSPGFNPSTNSGRGDWSLHDVTNGDVFLDNWWGKPTCIDHGVMNCVSKDRTIWRCIECGRGAFDIQRHEDPDYVATWSANRGGVSYDS